MLEIWGAARATSRRAERAWVYTPRVNFFGHATVASWRSSDPSFVLGAMLPDFAAMIRARVPVVAGAPLERGVAFHHETDDVFHDTVAFRELTARAFIELTSAGVGRGAARAAAHVGIEILLDGVLADEREARHAYRHALEHAPTCTLEWQSQGEHAAYTALIEGMRARGVSRSHCAPEVVAFRVERALAGRPRLALEAGEAKRIERWAERARHAVRDGAPSIVAELRALALG